ncbi:MAG: tRNA (N6-threonylcarbamoyladenosine(37)-N6)-methyltransferase TrmO [Clostridia bacterium]|nr:tRNA (N6-threonylcarbamoyladenosine(37)-N6)-methyltransferase TrmO [Clostridia bacterium]
MENSSITIKPIARIRTAFPEKFGLPRQSMLVPSLTGTIIFNKEFRDPNAFRGLEDYSHLWLIWMFSESVCDHWSPTVRPPRLGGNTRMGVFATRSPFRPNPLALSCVKIESIDLHTDNGPVITVSGIDMKDNTPIYDIKPYLPHVDSIADAKGGFSSQTANQELEVVFKQNVLDAVPSSLLSVVADILMQDPRPHYQDDATRVYGLIYDRYEIKFTVSNNTVIVQSIDHQN